MIILMHIFQFTATPNNAATQAVFKNSIIQKYLLINITMRIYNLIEYSDNYSDTSGSLWDFKRDERDNDANLTNDNNASSFKFKANLIGNTETNGKKRSKNRCTTKIFK